MLTIYYNPECSKCNATCGLLDKSSTKYRVIEYLAHPISKTELEEIIRKLQIKPYDLIRKSEPVFVEQYADKQLSDEEWVEILLEHPILMERPIVIEGEKAIICRPPEKLYELIG